MPTPPLLIPAPAATATIERWYRPLLRTIKLPLYIDLLLIILTLVPRLMLAHSIDVVTDEGVYIPIGRLDIALLAHGDITSSHWLDNYEAPPLPKLLMGLGSLVGQQLGGTDGIFIGARYPAIIGSAIFLVLLHHLLVPIIGRVSAVWGCLALAVSPWVAYFAAIAYLDTYLMIFMTLAIVITWYAARNPRLLPLVGGLFGLALAAKYTALLAIVPIAAYLAAYYRHQHGYPRRQIYRALAVIPLTLYLADPAIWVNPLLRLWDSLRYQLNHAYEGHTVFWLGQTWFHVPPGTGLYIIMAKMSIVLTIPALLVVLWGCRQWRTRIWHNEPQLFMSVWLVGLLIPFSLLTIIVGTHYLLPVAPIIACMGAWGCYRGGQRIVAALATTSLLVHGRQWAMVVAGTLLMTVPPSYGLITIAQAEGYTAEWLRTEDQTLQVAYPGYADALQWIDQHSTGPTRVVLIARPAQLDYWLQVRQHDFPARLTMVTGTPDAPGNAAYSVWPEHLIQRNFPVPADFSARIITAIKGGGTTYNYILRGSTNAAAHPSRTFSDRVWDTVYLKSSPIDTIVLYHIIKNSRHVAGRPTKT